KANLTRDAKGTEKRGEKMTFSKLCAALRPLRLCVCPGEFADAIPDFGKRVATVGREVLRDAERREKFWIVRENFRRCAAAIKIAEQAGNGLDDERIGIASEETVPGAELRHEPKFREAAGNQVYIHAKLRRKRPPLFYFFNEKGEPVLSVFQRGKLGSEFNLFFREVHGAEIF